MSLGSYSGETGVSCRLRRQFVCSSKVLAKWQRNEALLQKT